ncbi:MAG: MFS transporter [Gulosibacter sp.]|uniref:MFS transporter n=1 Tax=Gulosibacter sp. TaxID=2817531 RepID=UPI003F92D238
MLCDGMDVTIVSHIFPSLMKEWGIEIGGGIALVVSGGFIAMGIGALVAGRLADRFGRKLVFVAVTSLFAIATALGATAEDFTAFTAWRWIACLGMGAAMAIANTLLSELVPKERRSALLAIAYAAVGLGTSVGATFAGILLPNYGWRVLLLVAGTLPLVFAIVAAIVIPESPSFYAIRGQIEKAKRSLRRLMPTVDLARIDFSIPVISSNVESARGALVQLFSQRYALTTVLLIAFGFLSLGTQLTIVQYLPSLMQMPDPGLTSVESSSVMGTYGLASTIGGLLVGVFLARWSRFVVFGSLLVLSALVVVSVGVWPNLSHGTLLLLMAAFGFIIPSVLGPSRSILAAAAYPTAVRATGIGATEMGGRVGSAVGGAAGGALIGAGLTMSGFFLTLLVPMVLLFAALIGLKTIDSRTNRTTIVERRVPVDAE